MTKQQSEPMPLSYMSPLRWKSEVSGKNPYELTWMNKIELYLRGFRFHGSLGISKKSNIVEQLPKSFDLECANKWLKISQSADCHDLKFIGLWKCFEMLLKSMTSHEPKITKLNSIKVFIASLFIDGDSVLEAILAENKSLILSLFEMHWFASSSNGKLGAANNTSRSEFIKDTQLLSRSIRNNEWQLVTLALFHRLQVINDWLLNSNESMSYFNDLVNDFDCKVTTLVERLLVAIVAEITPPLASPDEIDAERNKLLKGLTHE